MKASSWMTILAFLLLTAAVAMAGPTDDLVVQHLFDFYELDPDSYEVEVLSNQLKSTSVDPGRLSIRPLSRKEPLGIFTVVATVSDDGGTAEQGQVRMRVKRFADVLVVLDRIGRFDPIAPAQVELRRRDVTDLREQAVSSLDDLTGMRAKRNLRKGGTLTSGDLEPIPLVANGHEVTIVCDAGLCRVTVPGKAMEDGQAGDRIKVRNEASRKVVIARVVDDDEVVVEP